MKCTEKWMNHSVLTNDWLNDVFCLLGFCGVMPVECDANIMTCDTVAFFGMIQQFSHEEFIL